MPQADWVLGPLGFKMPDVVAREAEALLKTLPKECQEYRKATHVPQRIDMVPGERADVSLVSAETLDRQNEVVIAKGMNLDVFKLNMIVTFAHRYDEIPVGKCLWIKHVDKGILAKTQYATKPEGWDGPWLPDAIFHLLQNYDTCKGKSVGFIAKNIRGATTEEVNTNPSWKNATIIDQAVLFEYAIAPVPVCPEAISVAVSKGMDGGLLQRLGFEIPTPTTPKKSVKASNDLIYKQLLQSFGDLELDTDQIAEAVFRKLSTRGRV